MSLDYKEYDIIEVVGKRKCVKFKKTYPKIKIFFRNKAYNTSYTNGRNCNV